MKPLALAIPVMLAGLVTLFTPSQAHAQQVTYSGGATVHIGGGGVVYAGHRHHRHHYSQPSSITVTVYESQTNWVQVAVADYDWRYDYSCSRWKWVQVGSHYEWRQVTRQVQRRYTAYWYSTGYGGYYGYTDMYGNFRIVNR